MFLRAALTCLCISGFASVLTAQDTIRDLQSSAVELNAAPWGYWGPDEKKYSTWTTHSNRLIPVYSFGLDLKKFTGENSIYRRADDLKKLYGREPVETLNPIADYCDQTDIYHWQLQAVTAGKKRVILMVFDGMDWQTTWAAAIHAAGKVKYHEGRGTGLHFQDYRGVATDYGYFVTSPYCAGSSVDVNVQKVKRTGKEIYGGYSAKLAGPFPWSIETDAQYPIGKGTVKHPYTDSSASATSLTAGIKTYNEAINLDADGKPIETIAHRLQKQGWSIGVVTSVPISHATPACAYAHNVDRDDYQDLTRDLLGLPSISHPEQHLAGVDVLLGAGWGDQRKTDGSQGKNFVPGNRYLTEADADAASERYVVVQRTAGKSGADALQVAKDQAIAQQKRLFGFFGVRYGHLPFRTANGDYEPTVSVTRRSTVVDLQGAAEVYTPADLRENPTLADLTSAALDVLAAKQKPFWLMVEAGDVDWANHANNIDNSIGAVISGDLAFRTITNWVEKHGGWEDTAVIVTADHGHFLHITRPQQLIEPRK